MALTKPLAPPHLQPIAGHLGHAQAKGLAIRLRSHQRCPQLWSEPQ
jgi:hypothetical protein